MAILKIVILSATLAFLAQFVAVGSPNFVEVNESALVLLRDRYPTMFELVMYNVIENIEWTSDADQIPGWKVGADYIMLPDDGNADIVMAGRLAHEAMHILLWKNCIQPGGAWGEEFAIYQETVTLRKLNRFGEYNGVEDYIQSLQKAIGTHGKGTEIVSLPAYCEGGIALVK
ncbi:hypothetical protein HYS94_02045 [Candidatus Daviesbacteria bacterium]|nr:hypothetical protein [Candidatus Daviesbacteria bacterium]